MGLKQYGLKEKASGPAMLCALQTALLALKDQEDLITPWQGWVLLRHEVDGELGERMGNQSKRVSKQQSWGRS